MHDMQLNTEQLKKFIIESGLVSKIDIAQAEKEAEEKKQKLGDVLVSGGKLKSTDLKRIEAYVLGIPFVSLVKEKIDFDTLSLIPEPIARTNNIVAFKKEQDALVVAMLDVEDLPTIDFIKKKTRLRIIPCLTDDASIKSVLQQYKKSLKAEFDDIIQKESASLKTVTEEKDGEQSEKDLKELAEDLPIVKYVTGYVDVSGSAKIVLDSTTYGHTSGIIISDGYLNLGGSGTLNGTGLSGSYILFITNSTCPNATNCSGHGAIDISGSAGSVVLNAQKGTINFSGSSSAKEATAYKLSLSGSTTVTYDSGLVDMDFTSGPTGSYSIDSWKESN